MAHLVQSPGPSAKGPTARGRLRDLTALKGREFVSWGRSELASCFFGAFLLYFKIHFSFIFFLNIFLWVF